MIEQKIEIPQPQRLIDIQAPPLVVLSEAAAAKLTELTAGEANPQTGLRVYVYSGGCSGFRYGMMLEDQPTPEDITVESRGIKVYVDAAEHLAAERVGDRLPGHPDGRRVHGQQPQRGLWLRMRQQLPDGGVSRQPGRLPATDTSPTGDDGGATSAAVSDSRPVEGLTHLSRRASGGC